MPFHLRLVGPPELRSDTDRPVALRTRKQLALLVVLALEAQRRPISRERLVDLLWPDSDRARARHSLSQALTSVRGVLGPDAIERRGAGIRLATRVRTDLDDPVAVPIEHLGPGLMLEGFDHLAGAEYSHWVDGARARIRRGLRAALSSQIRECRVQGQAARVQERAERLYHLDPGDAYATHLLAEHVAEMGDRGRAIDLLTEFLDRRRDAPADDRLTGIRRLLARLQAGADVPPEEESYARCERRLPFVGREREMRRLQAAWDAVGGDGGLTRTCLVAGRAGVGKSTLLRRFTGIIAADGRLVLRTTGDRAGRDVPFATVCGFLRQLSTDPDFAATDPHWLAEASRIAPFLRDRFPGIPAPPPATGETVRFSVAEAFYQILDTVAAGSAALLVVDDLHYLDAASRDVLYVLTRRQRAFGLMVVGTVRTHDIPVNGEEAPGEPGRIDWAERIDLGPLSPADTHTVLGGLLELRGLEADPEVRKTIVHLAAGIPYFVEVLVNDWTDQGVDSLAAMTLTSGDPAERWNPPPSIRHAFERRERAMSSAARDIYRLIAVAGTAIEPETIASITSHDVRTITQVLSDAIAAGELASRGASVAFTNEVHRAYVYRETPEPIRRFLHGRLGSGLYTIAGDDPTKTISAARHLTRAHPQTIPAVSCDHLSVLAEALNLHGSHVDAAKIAIRGLSGSSSQTRLRLLRAVTEALVRGRLGDHHVTRQRLDDYQREAAIQNSAADSVTARLLRAEWAAEERDVSTLRQIVAQLDLNQSTINEAAQNGIVTLTRGFCHLSFGNYARGFRDLAAAEGLFSTTREVVNRAKALNGCGNAASAMGCFEAAVTCYKKAFDCAVQTGNHPMSLNIASNMATTLVDFGQFGTAQEWFDIASEREPFVNVPRYLCNYYNNLVDYHTVTGDLDAAQEQLRRSHQVADQSRNDALKRQTLLAEADLRFAQGKIQEGQDAVRKTNRLLPLRSITPVQSYDSPHWERIQLMERAYSGKMPDKSLQPFEKRNGPLPIAAMIELVFVAEWLACRAKQPARLLIAASNLVRATGLTGVHLRAKSLGITPDTNGAVPTPNT